jgi:hypothetical protein
MRASRETLFVACGALAASEGIQDNRAPTFSASLVRKHFILRRGRFQSL